MDDMEYEEYLHQLGWLKHQPREGYPRKGHTGEHVYTEEWAKLMRKMPRYWQVPNGMLAQILTQLPTKITQRHAFICATFACWLGTNCGQSIILGAKRLIEQQNEFPDKAFLMTWATSNDRHYAVNGGFRLIEHLLAPKDHFGQDWLGFGGIRLMRRPELTVEDYETVECFMRWLGSNDGQAYIQRCEHEIKEMERHEHKAKRIGATP